jgi:hypothetical protein
MVMMYQWLFGNRKGLVLEELFVVLQRAKVKPEKVKSG